jgi:hypothetical protein
MDHGLEEAKRRFEAAPYDVGIAQAYEAALKRAGRGDEVLKLYRLAFVCDKKWEDLEVQPGEDPLDVRFCGSCQKKVWYVDHYAEFMERAKRGECVMVRLDSADHSQDVRVVHALRMMERDEQFTFTRTGKRLPCVVEALPVWPSFTFSEMGRVFVDGD